MAYNDSEREMGHNTGLSLGCERMKHSENL